MDTDAILQRFRAEKEVLGFLDHPGIAKLFDAGVTEDGRPYFAMQLVEGMPITKYCDERRLSIRDRLQIFVDVCRAVTHAHTKGVIHRDLKPANILVSSAEDGKPRAVVIDFGVSKSIDSSLQDLHTVTGGAVFLGTPEYMSPEQALGVSKDIDVRADVYSLGVVLYELLVGCRPFEASQIRFAGVDAIRKMIADVEPPAPSSRLASVWKSSDADIRSGVEQSTAVRQLTVDQLVRRLRGELDWITMKALNKERDRRYSSVADFERDVDNYLGDRPVEAGPISRMYRLRKAIRRHRLQVLSVLAIFASLAIGLAFSIAQTNAATKARDAARDAELRAKQFENTAKSRETFAQATQEFWNNVFSVAGAAGSGGALTVREALEFAVKNLDSEPAGDWEARAAHYGSLASAYFNLGEYEKSRAFAFRARDLYAEKMGASSLAAARAQYDMVISRWPEQGAATLDDLKASVEVILNASPGVDPANWERMAVLAALLAQGNRREEARSWLDRLEQQRRQSGDPEDSRYAAQVEMVRAQLATDPKDRVRRWAEAVRIFEARLGPEHQETVQALSYLAFEYSYGTKDLKAAAAVYEDLLARAQKSYAAPHLVIADAAKEFAACLLLLDDEARAEQIARKAITMYEQLGQQCDGVRSRDLLLGLEQMYTRVGHSDKARQVADERQTLERKCAGK